MPHRESNPQGGGGVGGSSLDLAYHGPSLVVVRGALEGEASATPTPFWPWRGTGGSGQKRGDLCLFLLAWVVKEERGLCLSLSRLTGPLVLVLISLGPEHNHVVILNHLLSTYLIYFLWASKF